MPVERNVKYGIPGSVSTDRLTKLRNDLGLNIMQKFHKIETIKSQMKLVLPGKESLREKINSMVNEQVLSLVAMSEVTDEGDGETPVHVATQIFDIEASVPFKTVAEQCLTLTTDVIDLKRNFSDLYTDLASLAVKTTELENSIVEVNEALSSLESSFDRRMKVIEDFQVNFMHNQKHVEE